MDQENEIREMWRIIRPYRFFIPLCGIVMASIGLFGQLGSPKVFQAEALVGLPQIAGNDSRDTGLVFVTVAETRAVTALLKLRLDRGDDQELAADSALQRLRLVRIDEVRGSDGYFKMTVRTTGDSRSALAALDRMLSYLNGNSYLMKRHQAKIKELEAGLLSAGQALKGKAGAEELAGQMERQNSLRSRLALVQNYVYVDRPWVGKEPVSPKPWRNFFLFGFLGLLLGVMLALLGHLVRTIIKTGVKHPPA
jgi:uncharacterized protein involved in exopolysaccharide biosynthesis